VQTIGTITDLLDQDTGIIDVALDAAINDVFGFQRVGKPIISRPTPIVANRAYHAISSFEVPANILALINKEQGTERLQELCMVLVIQSPAIQLYTVYAWAEIEFEEIHRTIAVR
jgi:hypothetical protein